MGGCFSSDTSHDFKNLSHQSSNVQQPVYQPNVQQPVYQPNVQQPAYQPNVQQPVYQPNVQQPVYQPNVQQPVYQSNVQQPVYQPNVQQPVYQPNVQLNTTSGHVLPEVFGLNFENFTPPDKSLLKVKKYIIFNYEENNTKLIGSFTQNVSLNHIKDVLYRKFYKTKQKRKGEIISLTTCTDEDICTLYPNDNIMDIINKLSLCEKYKLECKIPENSRQNFLRLKLCFIPITISDEIKIYSELELQKTYKMQIEIPVNSNYDVYSFDINLNQTVDEIKLMIKNMFKLNERIYELYMFDSQNKYRYMDEDKKMSYYYNNRIFRYICSFECEVIVKGLDGKSNIYYMRKTSNINHLKYKIMKETLIPIKEQHLVFGSKKIKDEQLIGDCCDKNCGPYLPMLFVDLLLRLRGGMYVDITSGNIDLETMTNIDVDIDFDADFEI
jgi:hypothetical protein